MRGRGFSMVEVAVATLILGGLAVAAIEAAGHAATGRLSARDRAMGEALGQRLLARMDGLFYEEPGTVGTTTPGPDAGESGPAQFDDVDDYHQFDEKDPTEADGAAVDGALGWRWSVTVTRYRVTGTPGVSATETGTKLIEIRVQRGDGPPVMVRALRGRLAMEALR